MKKCCVDNCQNECVVARRYCREHYLAIKKEQARKRYELFGRYKYSRVCEICNKNFDGDRKNSRFCSLECYYKYSQINSSNATNNYQMHKKTSKSEHRVIVESVLNRKLHTDEVVHHADCNPTNNNICNLIVMKRSDHVKLHAILTKHRATLSKDKDENSENCWKNLIGQITTTWLETTGVRVIKISDIGQSASEPLIETSNGEGSETMHGIPK